MGLTLVGECKDTGTVQHFELASAGDGIIGIDEGR